MSIPPENKAFAIPVVCLAAVLSLLLYFDSKQQAIENAYVVKHGCKPTEIIGPAYDADLVYQCDTGRKLQRQIRSGSAG